MDIITDTKRFELIYNNGMKAASFILMGLLFLYGCSRGEETIEPPAAEISGPLMKDKTALMRIQRGFIDGAANVGDKWDAYALSLRADLSEYASRELDSLGEVITTPKGKLIGEKFLVLLMRHHDTASTWGDTLRRLQEVEEQLLKLKEEGSGSVEERTARQIELLKEKRDLQGGLTGREQADIVDIENEIAKLFQTYK
jgi:hypothetical protein